MIMLKQELQAHGLKLRSSDEFGLPAEAKEAVAFALLARQFVDGQPGNVPRATGAKGSRILGKLSLGESQRR